MSAPEFSRPVRLDAIGSAPREIVVEADARERDALAARFGLIAIGRLDARMRVSRDGDVVIADGSIMGSATQACVASGQPVETTVDEPIALRFVPSDIGRTPELELGEDDLDALPYEDGTIDLGEAAAQGFALALDPFPRAPGAEAALRAAGVLTEEEAEEARREASPFAALKALRRD